MKFGVKEGLLLPMSLIIYGATDCDDTERTRHGLCRLGVPFQEVNIDHDPDAEQFVIFINKGYRSTPTLVLDNGRRKILITEPKTAELEELIGRG